MPVSSRRSLTRRAVDVVSTETIAVAGLRASAVCSTVRELLTQ